MTESDDSAPSAVPAKDEAKRLAETLRKRKYRAAKNNECIQLEAQAQRLRTCLASMKANERAQLSRLVAENSSLRAQVSECHDLLELLSHWAHVNVYPQRDLADQPTWIETTLLAQPITRRQGIQWLSERVYHQACRSLYTCREETEGACVEPFANPRYDEVDITYSLDVHVVDDLDEDGSTIAALETRYRHSTSIDYYSAASSHWETLLGVNSRISKELIERVGDRFMYYHHKNHFIGTNMLCIAGFFKEGRRVVITNCYVARDELFQHPQNVLRPHGFSWSVFEEIAPGFTRIHNFAIQYTPITANGNVISLDTIGRLFGRPLLGSQNRNAYIEQIRSAAEAAFVGSHKAIAQESRN
ncbi:hypothetical protein AeMF1_014445 [Aphanomyces euteiches]|nr:hypothetical protein AeMF1_014445 [Aphanomyces euteiches]KAH9182898.1 hypothetical protein AeNC1_015126 [Aphanomyces euteiches]